MGLGGWSFASAFTEPLVEVKTSAMGKVQMCVCGCGTCTIRDCNPGMLFQSQDFGIEKCQSRHPGIESRDWVPDFELVKISSNSLVLVSWWVLESWSICWSPVLTYFMWIIINIFTFVVSCRGMITILPLFNVKRNLLIFIKIQDRNVFFVFKVIVKFSAIIDPLLLLINSSN